MTIGPDEHTRYELDSALPPETVIATLVDFSERRRFIWRETCHPKVYRVDGLGDTWAEVTEGVPYAWSRERYEWSEPNTVSLRQLDSNIAIPGGTIEYRVTPNSSGGSHIVCERRRHFRGFNGRLLGTLMVVLGPAILRRQLEAGLRRAGGQLGPA